MNDVVVKQTFEEKMINRIKESIGDLIDEDQLKAIVDKGIEQIFFKPSTKTEGSDYSERVVTVPPLIESMLRKEIEPMFEAAVKAWVAEHNEEILAQIRPFLEASAGDLLLKGFTNMFQNQIWVFQSNIQNALSTLQQNRG